MSFGAPFGIPFGFASSTSPALDDPRALRRRAPIGTDEASPAAAGGAVGGMIPAGLLDAIMRPSTERGSPDFDATFASGQPGADGSMPAVDRAPLAQGMMGLAGQMAGQPAPQRQQPAVSPFSFAGAMPSERMEVGGGRGFGPGSAGAGLPLPPGGGAGASVGAGPGASPIARAAAGQPAPFPGAPRATNTAAISSASQDGAPIPPPRPTEFGGAGTWTQPESPATAPQAAAGSGAPAAADGPSFLDRVGQGITQNASLFTSLGAGLMSTPGFGPGVAAGLKMHQDQQAKQEVAGIARAELGLRLKKSAEDATGLKGNQALVKAAFPNLTPEQLASNNPQLVTAAIARIQNGNAGREMRADSNGVQRWVDTGQPVFAGDEGKSGYQLVDVPTGNGQTQKQWLKPGEAGGVAVGQPGQPKPEVRGFKGPDGTESTRVFNQQTGTWDAPDFGANPPASAAIDPNIPPGVDPATYRKELAKKTVTQQSQATDRANQASAYIPILERAERAYEALGKPNSLGATALGPLNASTPNRFVGGVFGMNSEKMRQEYEAAAKDLELVKAQITMKGQGSITDSERRLLALTLPRLDAADPETGLRTLRDLRSQFERTLSRERLPSYELNADGRPRGGEKFQKQMLQRRQGSRFDELMGQGMSKEEAFARMRDEGL